MSQGPHFFKKCAECARGNIHATAAENNHGEALEFRPVRSMASAPRQGLFLPHSLFVGPQDLQLLAGLQRVALFLYFVRCARCHIQAIIKLTVTGLDHCLVQIALGKITREIVCRQSRRQGARLLHCGFATFPGWFDRDEIGAARHDRAACEAGDKATDQNVHSTLHWSPKSPLKRGGSCILHMNQELAAQGITCTAALSRS
jgi:hypothetical protein